jgi:SAM-dependent methyltransferase
MPDATLPEAAIATLRVLYRRDLIAGTVAELLGAQAPRTTILDIGCGPGFFSMDLADRGFGLVQGIDLRSANIVQAEFLAEHYGVDGVSFAVSDADALGSDKQYDVVMNLGVLYHVVNPLQFIHQTYELCRQFAVIDTVCHREPISGYFMFGDKDVDRYTEGREDYELHPTYRGVIDTIRYAGFREVFEIVGESDRPHELYANGGRRCFLAVK